VLLQINKQRCQRNLVLLDEIGNDVIGNAVLDDGSANASSISSKDSNSNSPVNDADDNHNTEGNDRSKLQATKSKRKIKKKNEVVTNRNQTIKPIRNTRDKAYGNINEIQDQGADSSNEQEGVEDVDNVVDECCAQEIDNNAEEQDDVSNDNYDNINNFVNRTQCFMYIVYCSKATEVKIGILNVKTDCLCGMNTEETYEYILNKNLKSRYRWFSSLPEYWISNIEV
jgi:hypothetical protein